MDGISEKQLFYERMTEAKLLETHLHWISECAKMDLWQDITDTYAYKMRELLGNELRIRMAAE